MKKLGVLLAAAFLLSLGLSVLYGYGKDTKGNVPSSEGKKEFKEVAQAKGASVKKEAEKYEKKAQNELNEYKKKLKQLEAKAKDLKDQAKGEAKQGMGEVKKKIDVAERKLKSMKSASGEAWEKTKSEVDSALTSVKEGYKKIASSFK